MCIADINANTADRIRRYLTTETPTQWSDCQCKGLNHRYVSVTLGTA